MEFIENKGQWDGKVKYRGDFTTGAFFLEGKGFTVDLHNAADLKQLAEQQHGYMPAPATGGTGTSYNRASAVPAPNTSPSITVHSHAY